MNSNTPNNPKPFDSRGDSTHGDRHGATDLPVSELCMMRLVDGELADEERTQILKRLERQPNGWRDCALAFLEDQAWSLAIAEPAHGPSVSIGRSQQRTNTTLPSGVAHPPSKRSYWLTAPGILSLAAALLLAFAAGKWTPTKQSGPTPRTAEIAAGSPADGSAVVSAKSDHPPAFAIAPAGQSSAQTGSLVVLDEEFWKHDSALPRDLENQLKSHGARVKRQRGLMPVRANDGREWIVPYEDVQVVPVMNVRM